MKYEQLRGRKYRKKSIKLVNAIQFHKEDIETAQQFVKPCTITPYHLDIVYVLNNSKYRRLLKDEDWIVYIKGVFWIYSEEQFRLSFKDVIRKDIS